MRAIDVALESRVIREVGLDVAGTSDESLTAAIKEYTDDIERIAKHYVGKNDDLDRPLVFGDPEQISMLKRWRASLAEAADTARDIAAGTLRLWSVGYSVHADRHAEVAAYSEKQAQDLVTLSVHDLEEIDGVTDLGPTFGGVGVQRSDIF